MAQSGVCWLLLFVLFVNDIPNEIVCNRQLLAYDTNIPAAGLTKMALTTLYNILF